jgi:hypothetical protein
VDLLGRDGTSVNGRSVRFARIEDGDELALGRFRMQLCEDAKEQHSVLSQGPILTTTTGTAPVQTVESDAATIDDGDVIPLPQQPGVPSTHNQATFHAPVVGKVHGISENVLLAMMEQFGQMQQQLLSHTQQQMTMLAQMFSGLYQGQQASIVEQLNRIHAITSELNQLRAGTMVWPKVDARAVDAALHSTSGGTATPPVGDAPLAVQSGPPVISQPAAKCADTVVDVSPPHEAPGVEEQPDSPELAVTIEEATIDAALPFDEPVEATQSVQARAGNDPSKTANHEWVTQRINDLERERNGRWRRLLQLIGGGKDLN